MRVLTQLGLNSGFMKIHGIFNIAAMACYIFLAQLWPVSCILENYSFSIPMPYGGHTLEVSDFSKSVPYIYQLPYGGQILRRGFGPTLGRPQSNRDGSDG